MLRFDLVQFGHFHEGRLQKMLRGGGCFAPFPGTPVGELEAVTRTCLTQTGPSLASNSFSTLRGSPLMSLDGTAIPFGHLLGETGSCVKRLFFL